MAIRLFLIVLALVYPISSPLAQDAGTDLIRLSFDPPLGEDLVQRIDFQQDQQFGARKHRVKWAHDLVIHLTGREPPDLLTGRFTIRNVIDHEGSGQDPFYLFAKAVEGESFDLRMLQYGVPVEVDWPAIKLRISQDLPKRTDGELAAAITRVLPMFDPEGITAVMRPLWVTGIPYLRAFARDGSPTTVADLDLPAFYHVPKSTLDTYGGKLEGSEDILFVWRMTSSPQAAAKALQRELTAIVAQAAPSEVRAEAEAIITEAVSQGIEVMEGGVAVYDTTPGLMREITFDARLIAGPLRRDTHIVITRLLPE